MTILFQTTLFLILLSLEGISCYKLEQLVRQLLGEKLDMECLKLLQSDDYDCVSTYLDEKSLMFSCLILLSYYLGCRKQMDQLIGECKEAGERARVIVPADWDLLPNSPRKKGHQEWNDSVKDKDLTMIERENLEIYYLDHRAPTSSSTQKKVEMQKDVKNEFHIDLKNGTIYLVQLDGHSLDLSLKNAKVIVYRSHLRNVKMKLEKSEVIFYNCTLKKCNVDLINSECSSLNSFIRKGNFSADDSQIDLFQTRTWNMEVEAFQSKVTLQDLYFYKKLILKLKDDCNLKATIPNLYQEDDQYLDYSDVVLDLEEKGPFGDPKTFILVESKTKGFLTNRRSSVASIQENDEFSKFPHKRP